MTTLDIATSDGNVVLVLQDARLRVSSAVLSNASPVFKAMFGPKFSEGQGDRSVRDPKEVPLPDDNVEVMTRLCRLIHHQNDLPETAQDKESLRTTVLGLYDLVIMADKYACVGSIKATCGYLLFDIGSNPASWKLTSGTMLHLVAIAYNLGDSRHFALFTRRLVLYTMKPYSLLADCSAIAVLPDHILTLVGEQRAAAWKLFRSELPELALQQCVYRHDKQIDYAFPNIVATRIWGLATYDWAASDALTLEDVLRRTFHCADVDIDLRTACTCKHKVTGERLKELCTKSSKIACGLCLACLQAGNIDISACTHRQLLEYYETIDPIR